MYYPKTIGEILSLLLIYSMATERYIHAYICPIPSFDVFHEPWRWYKEAKNPKSVKYTDLTDRYIFKSINFEINGAFGDETDAFIHEIKSFITHVFFNTNEASFLRHTLALDVCESTIVVLTITRINWLNQQKNVLKN